MKQIIIIVLFFMLINSNLRSQDSSPDWGIKFTGFVKTDIFYDTRQSSASTGLREGHFYLYPDNVQLDVDGNDLNANPSFHMLSIQTRLKGDIKGPDAFGAKTSGVIEAEFFGTGESDINGFRLRHALVKLDWEKTSLIIGQTWHPMFPVESFPGTISFNTGAPFTPFSRNPQVRVTRKLSSVSVSLTAYAQRDFTSTGPDLGSNKYLRNSGMPGINILARIPATESVTAFAGLDFKRLRPELRTTTNHESDATIASLAAFANLKIKTDPVTISLMGVYAQNATDLVMLGGYAVSGTLDPVTQVKSYTNLNTGNIWADLTTTGSRVVYGLFTGYSKNLGSSDLITGAVYGRGTNIDHIFRVAPRASVTEGRLTFAAEVESTTAAYGTRGDNGKVSNTDNVSNLRILFSTIYKF